MQSSQPSPERQEKLSRRYSIGEEIANSVTHGVGAALSIAAMSILIYIASQNRDTWRIVSFSIYGSTLFVLYLASTLYHAFTHEKTKRFFRLMDHSSIFLLIAGTYTPPMLIAMRGSWGWSLFCLIWAMAVGGIIFELLYIGKYKFITVGFYMVMGWLVIIAIKPMIEMLPDGMMKWIILGGVFYTFGVVFYVWKKMPYNHAVWHLFVLAGSAMHFFGMLFYLAHQPA
jgi:hemolysin III